MSFWQNKSVIITGGGSGIGKALGAGLARRGAKVWLSDVNGASAAEAAEEIGASAQSLALDVADAEAVASHVKEVAHAHGRIDAVFNNAGIGVGGDIRELNLDHFNRSIDVNIRGVIHGVMAAFPLMKAQGGGMIVNTASAAGLLGLPLMAPYSMSKHTYSPRYGEPQPGKGMGTPQKPRDRAATHLRAPARAHQDYSRLRLLAL